MSPDRTDVCVFGALDPGYARNRVLRLGLRRLGVRVRVCAAPPWGWTLPRYAALVAAFARQRRAPVLLVPEFRHKDVPLARLLATLSGASLVVDPLISRYDTRVHDWRSSAPGSWAADHSRRVDRATVRFADLVLCDTALHAALFQRDYRVPAERCAVVPVGFDDVVFQPCPEPSVGPFRVAFFGSYLPLHGVDTILEAARILRDRSVRFLLIGAGQTFDHVERVRDERLGLEICAPLSPVQLVQRLRTAHVLLGIFGTTPKAARVVPNKVFQGLGLGRALITADTPAIHEFFEPDRHLCTVPAGDPERLAAAILDLRDQPAKRAALASAGAKHVHQHFAPEGIARRFLTGLGQIGVHL
jgi:glycosyltransferase involved in cell wall biosynthesis